MPATNKQRDGMQRMENNHARYVVDGECFATLSLLHGCARSRFGFTGSANNLRYHYTHGATTWAALLGPVASKPASIAKGRATRQTKRDEMAELCAELDRRKAAIADAEE